jgi:hypothetical protein
MTKNQSEDTRNKDNTIAPGIPDGMNDQTEIHDKILGFLTETWVRKDNQQLLSIDLLYAPGILIHRWVRTDEPDLFAASISIEKLKKLVTRIIEIATSEAGIRAAGRHRFIVRCTPHEGMHTFALSPSHNSTDQQVITSHAGQLMRINAQMFEGTIRVLGQQNMALHQQVSELTADNEKLRCAGDIEGKRLLAQVAGHVATGLLVSPRPEVTSPEKIATVAVEIAGTILKKVGL